MWAIHSPLKCLVSTIQSNDDERKKNIAICIVPSGSRGSAEYAPCRWTTQYYLVHGGWYGLARHISALLDRANTSQRAISHAQYGAIGPAGNGILPGVGQCGELSNPCESVDWHECCTSPCDQLDTPKKHIYRSRKILGNRDFCHRGIDPRSYECPRQSQKTRPAFLFAYGTLCHSYPHR